MRLDDPSGMDGGILGCRNRNRRPASDWMKKSVFRP